MTRREFIAKSIMDKSHDDATTLWLFALNVMDLDVVGRFIDKDKFEAIKAGLDEDLEGDA